MDKLSYLFEVIDEVEGLSPLDVKVMILLRHAGRYIGIDGISKDIPIIKRESVRQSIFGLRKQGLVSKHSSGKYFSLSKSGNKKVDRWDKSMI